MDAAAFDHLSRALSVPETRRRLLGLVATLPVLGWLLGWLNPEEGAAKDRRRRRKGRHKRRKHAGHRKPGCRPQGKAKTCAGTCGPIKNRKTCGKTVDCGSCDCPTPCGACLICQSGPNTPGACAPDPEQTGDPCGSEGQFCQADGTCACGADSCANPKPICAGGVCAACTGNGDCVAANAGGVCCAGSCYDGVCCGDGDCPAAAPDCAGHDCICSSNGNAACTGGEACCDDGCANLQTDREHCGDCQTACANPAPACIGGACELCTASSQCPACQACDGGLCVADASLQHSCANPCPGGEWCDAGACASIQDTVTLPDCHSVCSGSTEVCGQTVTCPACSRCGSQTGCVANELPDGPLGSGYYCSLSEGILPCNTNAECAAHSPWLYCNTGTGGPNHCARICPFST